MTRRVCIFPAGLELATVFAQVERILHSAGELAVRGDANFVCKSRLAGEFVRCPFPVKNECSLTAGRVTV